MGCSEVWAWKGSATSPTATRAAIPGRRPAPGPVHGRGAGGSLVSELRLFDLYRGDQVGPGRKSLAYSITYQAPDRTLTDEEVAQVRGRIVRRLGAGLGARPRGGGRGGGGEANLRR